MARNHKSKRRLSGYKRTIDGWESILNSLVWIRWWSQIYPPLDLVTSNKYSPLGRNIHSRAKISTPEQKYPPLSSWPAKHNSTRPALTPKPGLQHWLTLHSRARVNNVLQSNVQQSTQASKWSGWFYSGHRQTHTGWCSPRLGALRWHSAPPAYPTPHSTTAHLLLLVFLQQSLLVYC